MASKIKGCALALMTIVYCIVTVTTASLETSSQTKLNENMPYSTDITMVNSTPENTTDIFQVSEYHFSNINAIRRSEYEKGCSAETIFLLTCAALVFLIIGYLLAARLKREVLKNRAPKVEKKWKTKEPSYTCLEFIADPFLLRGVYAGMDQEEKKEEEGEDIEVIGDDKSETYSIDLNTVV